MLRVSQNASDDEIKRAYRRLARQFHPDVNPDDQLAEERLKELNEAYEVLGNPESRRQYDRSRSRVPIHRSSARKQPSDPFQDLFDMFFGEAPDLTTHKQHARGRTYEAHVTLDFEETVSGKEITLSIEGRRLQVHIPPGVRDGMTLRVSGAGGRSVYSGGVPGDLVLRVHVRPHPRYRVQGQDLIVDARVDLFTALLGGEITVETPYGPRRISIPAGTQPDSTLRVRGLGLPLFERPNHRGDLVIHVQVALPRRITETEEHLIRRWKALRERENEEPEARPHTER